MSSADGNNNGAYGGRRAPNFSQYLNELNMIPSPFDEALIQEEQNNLFDIDAELAKFTNTDFLDFETGMSLSHFVTPQQRQQQQEPQGQDQEQGQEQQQDQATPATAQSASSTTENQEQGTNYLGVFEEDFDFTSFANLDADVAPASGYSGEPVSQQPEANFPASTTSNPAQSAALRPQPSALQSQPSETQVPQPHCLLPVPQQSQQQQQPQPQPSQAPIACNPVPIPRAPGVAAPAPITPAQPSMDISSIPTTPASVYSVTATGAVKRTRTDSIGGPMYPSQKPGDDMARISQEEDRRRRNTAASARFRVKKKEREKNMERMVSNLTSENAGLRSKVSTLEMENKWLKSLITEKNSWADGDLSSLFDKFKETLEQKSGAGQAKEKGKKNSPPEIRPHIRPHVQPQPQFHVQPQAPMNHQQQQPQQ